MNTDNTKYKTKNKLKPGSVASYDLRTLEKNHFNQQWDAESKPYITREQNTEVNCTERLPFNPTQTTREQDTQTCFFLLGSGGLRTGLIWSGTARVQTLGEHRWSWESSRLLFSPSPSSPSPLFYPPSPRFPSITDRSSSPLPFLPRPPQSQCCKLSQ